MPVMLENILRLALAALLAVGAGKLDSLLKMPSVLGVLIAGMALGPNAFGLLSRGLLDNPAYRGFTSLLECGMGLMLGSGMVWRRLRSYGRQVVVITLAQSLTAFLAVSLAFSVIFWFQGLPVFLGLIFGSIALATAPAPALSIVREYKTDGPVTRTLLPLAVMDDVAAICVFFSVMGFVAHKTAGGAVPGSFILLIVLLPAAAGLLVGFPASLLLRRLRSPKVRALVVFAGILGTAALTMLANRYLMPRPVLNFMLSGMVYSAVFANRMEEAALEQTMKLCGPGVGACFTLVILDLGAPLDYRLVLGAGAFTAVYILSRAAGKIGGAALGAQLSHASPAVKKYLGLTLLPHSGVSLVFTGIAASALSGAYSQYGDIVRGTIAAAAVINEVIAVFAARKGFQLAGELRQAGKGEGCRQPL